MNTIKTGWAQEGYTIIEVMIFLAVSGMMFVLAAVFISGKQGQVAYQQGIQAAGSTVTNVINSVANGEYPSINNFSCSAQPGGQPQINSFTQNKQGTNGGVNASGQTGCVYLGQVLQLGTNTDKTSYRIFTIAGRQYAPTTEPSCAPLGTVPPSDATTPVQSFCEAQPIAVDTSGVNQTQTNFLEQGLNFNQAYLCNGDCSNSSGSNSRTSIGGVGFFGSFGSYTLNNADTESSGAQSVTVVPIPSVTNPTKELDMVNEVNQLANYGDSSSLASGEYVVLCFAYGNKPGSVVIGGQNGQQTSVSVNLNKDQQPC